MGYSESFKDLNLIIKVIINLGLEIWDISIMMVFFIYK